MEYVQMRDFSEFCEQLNDMKTKFQKWDSCERTVALYYLMVGLPFANAKFLQNALEYCIANVTTADAKTMEQKANDAGFICSLLSEKPQTALATLLTHLPLLRPNNKDTAHCYLVTIRKVLGEFIKPTSKIYNECVEIMSYVFIHPAFEKDDKKSFKHLLKHVVNRVTPENFIHSPMAESSDESNSPNPEPVVNPDVLKEKARTNRRSNSLTPAQNSSHENLGPTDVWSSQENLMQQMTKPRSYSLSYDKTVNLQPNLQASSSETKLQELQTMNNLQVMKSIVSWLKSLRLHKYSWVFNNLNYQQILELTEHSLSDIGITKGARHKLLLSIGKLKERSMLLTELETEIMNGGDLLNALKKLKCVLQSPLQVSNGEDLATHFVKVMGKVCTQLLMLRHPSEECLVLFSTLCERAECSEAFATEQKKRLMVWKEQLARENYNVTINEGPMTNCNFRLSGNQPFASGPSHVYNQKSSSFPSVSNYNLAGHRHSIAGFSANGRLLSSYFDDERHNRQPEHLPHFQIGNNQQHHVRFKDSELDKTSRVSHSSSKNVDIESSLESLCLQMMEHALGP